MNKILFCLELPPIPEGITNLDCSRCTSLKSLPPLPDSLTSLVCSDCPNLTHLPPKLTVITMNEYRNNDLYLGFPK